MSLPKHNRRLGSNIRVRKMINQFFVGQFPGIKPGLEINMGA
jgi:hypothetical protein